MIPSAVRLLVVTAVPSERDALVGGVTDGCPAGLSVAAVGVGPAAAAAGTARLLALAEAAGNPYHAVISAGIAGGFAGRVRIGDTVLATRTIAADLGADSPDGYLSLDELSRPGELGFGTAVHEVDPGMLEALRIALPAATTGPVLTVSTVTGTRAGTDEMLRRYPDAVAEAMEGFGVGVAADRAGIGFAEVRAVSNEIGPRDVSGWRIGAALAALTEVGRALDRYRLGTVGT